MYTHLATWLIQGAKLVGPYNCTDRRVRVYASSIPSTPWQYGFEGWPFWNEQLLYATSSVECVLFMKKVKYQEELVRNATVRRQPRSEAERREQFVRVVVLNDLAHSSQRSLVVVRLEVVVVMQRCRLIGIAIRSCEVHTNRAVDLTPAITTTTSAWRHAFQRKERSQRRLTRHECSQETCELAQSDNSSTQPEQEYTHHWNESVRYILQKYTTWSGPYHPWMFILLSFFGLFLRVYALKNKLHDWK